MKLSTARGRATNAIGEVAAIIRRHGHHTVMLSTIEQDSLECAAILRKAADDLERAVAESRAPKTYQDRP